MRLQWPKGATIKAVNPYYYANGSFCRKNKFFQGTNRCYDKAVAGRWFSLRDLMGGENFDWRESNAGSRNKAINNESG